MDAYVSCLHVFVFVLAQTVAVLPLDRLVFCGATAWIVLIAVTGQAIYHMPRECTAAGHQYIATVAGLLVCFVTGLCLECLLIWESCQGAPLNAFIVLVSVSFPPLVCLHTHLEPVQGASLRYPNGGGCPCSLRFGLPTPRARWPLQVVAPA